MSNKDTNSFIEARVASGINKFFDEETLFFELPNKITIYDELGNEKEHNLPKHLSWKKQRILLKKLGEVLARTPLPNKYESASEVAKFFIALLIKNEDVLTSMASVITGFTDTEVDEKLDSAGIVGIVIPFVLSLLWSSGKSLVKLVPAPKQTQSEDKQEQ